jgi:PAS domain-containing protein
MDASTPVGQWISDLVYLSGDGIACFAYLFVGVRLYRLSRRTGQLPEFLIAACFLLWVLSYAFYDIPYAIVASEELVPAVCSYGSLVTLVLGNVAFALFIRSVFRPDARWATWLVAAIAVSNFAGLAGMGWIGDWEGINPLSNSWYWMEFFGSFAPSIWMGAEGLAQYLKARRRLKLGLCEPMACNRFLLWAIAGALWVILEGILTANDVVNALTGEWSELLGFGVALFEVFPVTIIWFVFFPPAFYCRWIEGSGKPADAALK